MSTSKRGKRRTRSPHPGVVLLTRTLPSGATSVRARFTDPDTDRVTYTTLDLTDLSTQEARREWAIRKSKALARRRMDLEAGAPRLAQTDLSGALKGFYEAAGHRLKASTLTNYRHGIEKLAGWAARHGVQHTEDVTAPRLAAFRDALVAEGKHVAAKGATRGARRRTEGRRSPVTVNTYLTGAKVLLNHWRALGLVPALSKDAISDALKPLREHREEPEYLQQAELVALLEAAIRHDAGRYTETREEHAGKRAKGTTARYAPIAPFVTFVLLAGCRRSEALSVRWEDIDLAAKDREGNTVGEIRLRAHATKTKRARTIGLEVSPGLRKLLATLKLQAQAKAGYVFGGAEPYTAALVEAARDRLQSEYGAPAFTWQMLRSTCATYLTCSSGIWGSATVFLSAKQLGHSVRIAEQHYLGVHRGIAADANTLEAAMGVLSVLQRGLESGQATSVASRSVG